MYTCNISSWVQCLGGFVHFFILCFAEFCEHCCVTEWVYPTCSNELLLNACFPFDLACILILLLHDVELNLVLLMEWKEDVRETGSVSDTSGGKGGGSRGLFRHRVFNPQPLWIKLFQFIPLVRNEQIKAWYKWTTLLKSHSGQVSVVAGDPHERQRGSGQPGPGPSQTRSRSAGGTSTAPAMGVGTSLGLGTSPGPTGGLSLIGPRAMEAGDQSCCGITEAGADGPRGLTWSPGSSALEGCEDALQAWYWKYTDCISSLA